MISNEESPNSSRSLTKLLANQNSEIESYAYKVAFTLVCGILMVTNGAVLLVAIAEPFSFLVAALLVVVCGCWMNITAAWAVLGFGKLWKWLLVTTISVSMVSVLLSVPSLGDKYYLAASLMGCILAFLGVLPFFLGAWAILRWRNWRLVYQSPHSPWTSILVPQLRWSILDLMVVTGNVAVTIAILSLCHRTLEGRDGGMFGPYFWVAILVYGSLTLFAASMVTLFPSLIIGMNRRTTTKQKQVRLISHLFIVTLVASGLCLMTGELWSVVPMTIGIAMQACWSFLALPVLVGFDKPGWLRFGLIRMPRPIKQVPLKVR
jgi:hypothetical protein